MNNKFLKGLFSEIESIPPVLQNAYFPSLDGLSGFAIIMVVVSHLHPPFGYYMDVIFNGKTGVLIFLVLSGFLITTLCIKEKVITKNISLKDFCLRKALRIFPVGYLYIFAIIILNFVFSSISAISVFWVPHYI